LAITDKYLFVGDIRRRLPRRTGPWPVVSVSVGLLALAIASYKKMILGAFGAPQCALEAMIAQQ
jgi:hypothetical protein